MKLFPERIALEQKRRQQEALANDPDGDLAKMLKAWMKNNNVTELP